MSRIDHSTNGAASSRFAKPSTMVKTGAAAAAVLISTSLLGGLLALFEMQSLEATATRTVRPGTPAAPIVAQLKTKTAHD
jgi:hypothetical protein